MRLNLWKPLTVVLGSLLLCGCYSPWLYPGNYGYRGYNGYGYGYPSYGGYQGYPGIQTLTPGQYYDPNLSPGTPTFAPGTGNGLSPEPSPANSGAGSGDGGDARPYNPGAGDTQSRPVPMYPENGAGLQPPATDGEIKQEKPDLNDAPSPEGASLQRAPSSWAQDAITPAGHQQAEEEPAEMLAPTTAEPAADASAEATAEQPAQEEPPLFPAPTAP